MTGPSIVYVLCVATCVLCAGLLIRSWLKTQTRLLLWAAISFVFLAVNNFFLLADALLLPNFDLSALRQVLALTAVTILVVGLVWEAE